MNKQLPAIINHPFVPVFSENCRILILGSMLSRQSRANARYPLPVLIEEWRQIV